ncbi:MAG: sensor histidine kinase [Burkholderiaceae bacterium]|jgi:signal transduction histidine kinase|nr:sensor histidine kinase [Burkholderiaceae bacterium]
MHPVARGAPAPSLSFVPVVSALRSPSLRGLLALLLAALLLLGANAARAISIERVEWTPIAVGGEPAADATWTRLTLPLRWSASEDAALTGVALRMTFTLTAVPNQPWALLLGHATNGGRVSVNGRSIGTIRMADAGTQVRWRKPHLLAIDPTLLVGGNNVLMIQTAYRGGAHGLADVEVGPLSELSGRYERQFFSATTLPWIGATLAAAVALLFGVLWLRRPDRLLALLTIAATLWVARSAYFLIEATPVAGRFWLLLIYYTATGGFAVVITLAMLRLSGRMLPRDEWATVGFGLFGPFMLVVTAQHAAPYLDQLWVPTLIGMCALAFAYALMQRARQQPAPHPLLLAAVLIALGAALHDWLLTAEIVFTGTTLWMHWAGPLLLVALATPLVDRFIRILGEAETARAELETRVREREQLLKRNYERLRESERLQVQAQERQRIMQDMHDGLGSQLLSSLMLVERGAVTQPQMVQMLRESIDDMRLAIDALAAEDAGLLSALGNLRYRMEPRLKALGMDLHWDTKGLPEEIDINPDAVLPILRIVQEALTNAMKHSQARAVHLVIAVERGSDADWLSLRVTDNGRGIVEERVGGRGLLNMRNRANRIGAQLKIETVPGAGTMVALRYKIEHEAGTGDTRLLNLNTEAVIERVRRV